MKHTTTVRPLSLIRLTTHARGLAFAAAIAAMATSFSVCRAEAPPHLVNLQTQQQKIAERAIAATVGIMGRPVDGRGPGGPGSGVIIGSHGLILTAAHAVAGAEMLDVTFSDGTKGVASVAGIDGEQDLALAQIVSSCGPFPFVDLAPADPITEGSAVFATGHFGGFLQGRQPLFRAGSVKNVANLGNGVKIVTNCLVGPGDSGGPLFDEQGRVIGVHHALRNLDLTSVSVHSPVSFVLQNMSKLMDGKRWGNYERWIVDIKSVPTTEELAGLDLPKFTQQLFQEIPKGIDPQKVRTWLREFGMSEKAVTSLSDPQAMNWVSRALSPYGYGPQSYGSAGFAYAGASAAQDADPKGGLDLNNKAGNENPTSMPAGGAERLNVEKFKDWFKKRSESDQGPLWPAQIREQLIACGMDRQNAEKLDGFQIVEIVRQILEGKEIDFTKYFPEKTAPVAPATQPAATVAPAAAANNGLGGLNESSFKEWVMEEARKSKGMLALPPQTLREHLVLNGLDKGVADKMTDVEMIQLVQRLMSGVGQAYSGYTIPQQAGAPGQPETTEAVEMLRGIDRVKFRAWVMDEVVKSNGALRVEVPALKSKLVECGMNADAAEKLSEATLYQIIPQILMDNSAAPETASQQSSINVPLLDTDRKALEPMLAKLSSSIVRLTCEGKQLVMGTIVSTDGLILTKLSEISDAHNRLTVQLSDGRTFPAKVVQSFSGDDLALVKIDADNLPSLTFPSDPSVLSPGTFVFTPGNDAAAPLLSAGVVSVREDQLHSAGNLIGIGVEEEKAGLVVRQVVDNTPAHKVIKLGDVVLAVNGQALKSKSDIIRVVQSVTPGTKVSVEYRRDGELRRDDVEVVAGEDSPWVLLDKSATSKRPSGYPICFENDQPLKPNECGGPLMGINGEVVGVNIARSNRSGSRAIPSRVIVEILKNVKP